MGVKHAPAVMLVATVALLLATLWLATGWARNRALSSLAESSRHVLTLVVESLRGELAKHQSTPYLLAHNPRIVRIVTGAAAPEEIRAINDDLARLATVTEASDIYLMATDGTTVAASNHDRPTSFIGRNFNYRPYFLDAMKGRPGRYFALGTTSGERGYYFAEPVFDGRYVVGVAVVKIQVGRREAAWHTPDHDIIVTDDDGVVFLSSRPEWILKSTMPLSQPARERIALHRRYDGHPLRHLEQKQRSTNIANAGLVEITPPPPSDEDRRAATTASGKTPSRVPTQYLVQTEPMQDAGWTVQILSRTAQIQRRVNEAITLVLATFAALSLAAIAVHQRRRRIAERLQLQESIKSELEHRVAQRTDELTRANQQLEAEVTERRRTEKVLIETQSSLVQASKLAALGQMSAGLSHELNQPLAAIRSYADNALKFIERDRHEKAATNLASIADLTERMARIIRHLRTYARKEPTELRPTYVKRAVDDALTLMQRRIDEAGIHVDIDIPDSRIVAIVGEVRLQQVIVNLISNAIDAMKDAPTATLRISVGEDDRGILISVADTGTGIAPATLPSVFDPFFTTKDVGEGLGLGLSISYGIVKQFGGEITARNRPEGGAVFDVRLQSARSAAETAA